MSIIFTENAEKAIENIFKNPQHGGKTGMRVGFVDGGCQGKSYLMEFSDKSEEDHTLLIANKIPVYISPLSLKELSGTTIDYSDQSEEKGFIFKNPNAEKTCGCGGSYK